MSKVLVSETNLLAIGDAIREKNGLSDKYKPGEMAAAISAITTGGGGEEFEIPVITGNCGYRFANDGWTWFIEDFGDKITTENITLTNYMFYNSTNLAEIPFDINCKLNTSMSCRSMFESCYELKNIPKITNCKTNSTESMFYGCYMIKSLPEDIESWFDWSEIENSTSAYGSRRGSGTIKNCYRLRSFPMGFLNHENQNVSSASYGIYYSLFNSCYVLEDIVGLPVHYRDKGITANFFNSAFVSCGRLTNLTFAVQEDGTPYTAKWKSQTIDLSSSVGWVELTSYTAMNMGKYLGYDSTETMRVRDDETYQALKDNPDWYAANVAYSRYNHDSAVATLNSLPDTSAYGTNTIKFKGAAGSSTDGGAINTLTDEEIAVAAAKGWTVTLS